MALSKETRDLMQKLLDLNVELDARVRAETEDKYGFCRQTWVQIRTNLDWKPTPAMVQEDLGSTELVDEGGTEYTHYSFKLEGVKPKCAILLDLNTRGADAYEEEAGQEV